MKCKIFQVTIWKTIIHQHQPRYATHILFEIAIIIVNRRSLIELELPTGNFECTTVLLALISRTNDVRLFLCQCE